MHRAVSFLVIFFWISFSIDNGAAQQCNCQLSCDQRRCPDSTWKKFTRTNGHVVCFKPVEKSMDFLTALTYCVQLVGNGTLMGIETQEELDYVKQLGKKWYHIGAYRNQDCNANKTELLKIPECSDDKMFQFFDGVTKGTFLWNNHWIEENPNSYYRNNADVLQGALCGVTIC
ncbi:unnamed protein product [Caenorhabditis bovis]|uniref:C-type lectin domain-containing protein n=1 Tax=Caenorhabditis bovis TaxID=2654633 RepID=A0A8S1EHL3_9PELO|nr:unnamed protein product [Caenorhabditis bovis]